MSMFNIFDIAGSGMNAQSVRLNTVASNLANAESASNTEAGAYRSKHPVFSAVMMNAMNGGSNMQVGAKVKVDDVIESDAPVQKRYEPNHPLADVDGNVFYSNVNVVEQMADMISASRSFQADVELMSTSKTLMLRTLQLGQS